MVREYISQKAIKHGFKHCPIKTINADHLDELVRALVLDHVRKCAPGLDAQLARDTGAAETRIIKLLPLTRLGPPVLKHALSGTLTPSSTLNDLLAAAAHLDWDRQTKSISLDRPAPIAPVKARPTAA